MIIQMEEKTAQQQMDELQEWLENNEIDHPDYPDKFVELRHLMDGEEYEQED